jgi:hypothetical protein
VDARETLERIVFFSVVPDLSSLTDNERAAMFFVIRAAQIIERINLRQVNPSTVDLIEKYKWNSDDESQRMVKLMKIMGGPWNQFDANLSFVPGVGKKPEAGPYYPPGMDKEEFQAHIERHPEDRAAFESNYTIIVRDNGLLKAIPYSEAYKDDLKNASDWLKAAAELLDPGPLQTFLELQADAFITNDYFKSDMAWVDTDGTPFEVIIGPHETYEDELLGHKAMFEAIIGLKNTEATNELQKFLPLVAPFDQALASNVGYKLKGARVPLTVIEDVYRAGETAHGRQFTALNLPNDRKIHELKGSKKLISKIMIEEKTKFAQAVAERILNPHDLKHYNSRGRLLFVLFHELAHGIGPGTRVVNGVETSFEKLLLEYHSPLEEAKADMVGSNLMVYAYSESLVTPDEMRSAIVSEVVFMVIGWRASLTEAHSFGSLIEYNWLKRDGALDYDEKTGHFVIDVQKCFRSMTALGQEFIKIQMEGSYDKAKAFVEKWGYVSPELPAIVDSLRDLPLEVYPEFKV